MTGAGPRSPAEARPAPPRGCTVVAIDGSAGAGKSTTAAAVASRLGFRHLDSGAIYRAVTFALLESESGIDRVEQVTPEQLAALDVRVDWDGTTMRMRVGGRRVPDEALRDARVTGAVSRVAAVPLVRSHLLALQREAAQAPGLVAEGRDMATVVFPDAEVKVYLDADVRVRARRRILERSGPDRDANESGAGATIKPEAEVEAEAARLAARDHRDSSRAIAPLARARGAVTIDTTHLDRSAQTDAVVRLALPFLPATDYI